MSFSSFLKTLFGVKTVQPSYEPRFKIVRGSMISPKLATLSEVELYLAACGMVPESQPWEAALVGNPFLIDGAQMQFIAIAGELQKQADDWNKANEIGREVRYVRAGKEGKLADVIAGQAYVENDEIYVVLRTAGPINLNKIEIL